MSLVSDNEGASVSPRQRRRVSIRRDDTDFIVAFQPDDIVVFRNNDAKALRRVCEKLRWEIVSDTTLAQYDIAL